MSRYTRRQFLSSTAAAGLVGWRALGTQAAQGVPIPLPGLEVGEITTAFALRNVTVIDATGRPTLPGMTVVISGNRIQSVGPTARTALAPGAPVVEASGKFLIPGLWDMHSHLPADSARLVGVAAAQVSPLFIPNGVTGTRTMGGSGPIVTTLLTRRAEIAEGKRLGPRLVVAGPTIRDVDIAAEKLARSGAPAQDIGRYLVRSAVESGVDCIKVHNAVPREAYFAVLDEARRLKVPVVGHVPNQPPDPLTLAECANAGQRSFEHMAGVLRYMYQLTGVDRGGRGMSIQTLNAAQTTALVDVFLKNRAWLCPTLTTLWGLRGEQILAEDPRLKYFSADAKTRWAAVFKNTDLSDVRERYEHSLGIIGALHKAGVGILAGTDTSLNTPEPYAMPGFGLHDELARLVNAGLSPMDALRAATYRPAEFLGLLDSLGTVEPGKLAELVLLDGNPLDDIANTTKINMVFTSGRVYRRPALNAMLNAVEANARN